MLGTLGVKNRFMELVEDLSNKIAGEIALSPNPSKTIRKWRELFGLTQTELARYLETSPSVVCDYESGRRESPGTKIVRRFVMAMVRADSDKGHPFLKSYELMRQGSSHDDVIIDLLEFPTPISINEFCEAIKGKIVAGKEFGEGLIYGYTVIDSLKAIVELASNDFYRLYGGTSQRALVFTKVSYGRSPFIAVRVSPLKPKVMVMHGVESIDRLGEKIALAEHLPVILVQTSLEKLLSNLRSSVI